MKFGTVPCLSQDEAKAFDGQPGQWVSVNGRKGRYIGRTEEGAWFLWTAPYRGESLQAMRKVLQRLALSKAQTKDDLTTEA